MKKNYRLVPFLLGALPLMFCGLANAQDSKKLIQLKNWMQGSFNSEKQSKEDKEFFNIHLNTKEIWKGEGKGTWLYVEQAAEGYLDKPYRQRVYQLKQIDEDKFASVIYTFEEPLKYAGDFKKEKPLDGLSPSSLKKREGCTVFLQWQEAEQSYTGSTDAKKCLSKLRGATYATSEVTVSKNGMVSWDRGYDAQDKQVWGAVKAGYIFLKQ